MRRLLTTLLAVLLACAPALAAAEGLWGQLFGQSQEPETILVEIDVAGYHLISRLQSTHGFGVRPERYSLVK